MCEQTAFRTATHKAQTVYYLAVNVYVPHSVQGLAQKCHETNFLHIAPLNKANKRIKREDQMTKVIDSFCMCKVCHLIALVRQVLASIEPSFSPCRICVAFP